MSFRKRAFDLFFAAVFVASGDQHFAVLEQRYGVAFARRCHASRRSELAGDRIVDFSGRKKRVPNSDSSD